MGVLDAFTDYQRIVDADPAHVALARERRDIFVAALSSAPGVVEIVKSGSLQRSTQLDPIHDVDLIAVFDTDTYPQWGTAGCSSEDALNVVHDLVVSRLGATAGTHDRLVRLAWVKERNRSVKCFVDDPDAPHPFTVDVMPALRQSDRTLLVPSTLDQRWSVADPEYLIEQVRLRQQQWQQFRPMVRLLKKWRLDAPVEGAIKSLVMEVLALDCLPTDGNRPHALRSFFTAAAARVGYGVMDPAGHCGAIQPDLDIAGLRVALSDAADHATLACDLAARNDTDGALRAWREVLGPDFPAPEPGSQSSGAVAVPLISDAPQG